MARLIVRQGENIGDIHDLAKDIVTIGRDEKWDATQNGVRLVLAFDPQSNAFVGAVEELLAGLVR